MSKVVIQGNASGTGDFTIAAPNSNTDRTLTLPDEAGTVLTTAGVPASAISDNSITSAKLTGDAVPIGVGQTWQNVVGSRAVNTTYTNTTGKPIMAHVYCTSISSNYVLQIIVDGIAMNSGSSDSTDHLATIMIIPNGSTYRVTFAGGSGTLSTWKELR